MQQILREAVARDCYRVSSNYIAAAGRQLPKHLLVHDSSKCCPTSWQIDRENGSHDEVDHAVEDYYDDGK